MAGQKTVELRRKNLWDSLGKHGNGPVVRGVLLDAIAGENGFEECAVLHAAAICARSRNVAVATGCALLLHVYRVAIDYRSGLPGESRLLNDEIFASRVAVEFVVREISDFSGAPTQVASSNDIRRWAGLIREQLADENVSRILEILLGNGFSWPIG